MVEVGVWFGIGNIGLTIVLFWRLWRVEMLIDSRIQDLDMQLASVINHLLEKVESIGSNVPDINLINQNPFGQIIDFLRNREHIASQPHPAEPESLIEVESNATTQEEKQTGQTG